MLQNSHIHTGLSFFREKNYSGLLQLKHFWTLFTFFPEMKCDELKRSKKSTKNKYNGN
jgi:hypothetical protein